MSVNECVKSLGSSRLPRLFQHKIILDLTRRQGYATGREEYETGLSGVAAPVFDKGNRVITALGMVGPTPRFLGPDFTDKIKLINEFAARF